MPDYSKGKIYTIRCRNDPSQIYVGSTIQPLSQRFGTHKKDKMKFPHYPLYKQVEDWSDWYIELYEDFPCERKEQLEKREGEIIRTIATLNKNIAGRKYQEYYTENKEKIDFQQKQYREENKDLRNEKQKEYYRHSGYPGGFRRETLEKLRIRKPTEVIRHAVAGMVPQNRLKASMLKRLYVFPEAVHTYGDKFKVQEVVK